MLNLTQPGVTGAIVLAYDQWSSSFKSVSLYHIWLYIIETIWYI